VFLGKLEAIRFHLSREKNKTREVMAIFMEKLSPE
jgi:hypothetical protein